MTDAASTVSFESYFFSDLSEFILLFPSDAASTVSFESYFFSDLETPG